MKFAMCNEFCEGWSFAQACELAAEAGYDGIEIAPFTLAESVEDVDAAGRRELRQTAEGRGLEVVGLHWLLVKPEGLHLNAPEPAVRQRTADYLKGEVDFCADLGGRVLIFGSPAQRDVAPGQDYGRVWARSVEVFRALGEHAAARGVTFCIEPLGRSETNFVTSAAEARDLVEAVDRPGFRMMLDVKAMAGELRPMPEIIRECAPYVEHFHANDAEREGPGFGETDFRPIAAALQEVGYDGYVSVEVFDFSAGPERIARESLDYLRRVFA